MDLIPAELQKEGRGQLASIGVQAKTIERALVSECQ